MTTTIFTNLLGPFCELYYKYQRALALYQANINTIRNYGFATQFSLNFGFELYQPFDFNNIRLQPGVFTTQSQYVATPLGTAFMPVSNLIVLQELPIAAQGIITYINSTLPIKISIGTSVSTIIGIASNYATNGIPYAYNSNIDTQIIRQFESDFVSDNTMSILIFVNLANSAFVGIQTFNWTVLETSLYSTEVISYRYNNGFGQFYSYPANFSFIPNNLAVDQTTLTNLYNTTYAFVYNWINYLTWVPNFETWLEANASTLPIFFQMFLSEYFNLP